MAEKGRKGGYYDLRRYVFKGKRNADGRRCQ